MRGKFIVVEGLEGAGKSTVMSHIANFLEENGLSHVATREPGGTPMAEAIRDCVKANWQESVTHQTELLLMYAARSQLVENVIKPALNNGQWVIGDRHDLSTVAYQGGGRGIAIEQLRQLRELTLGDFCPDFTLYLDIDPVLGLERARGRGELDRIEVSGIDFFQRARQTYLQEVSKLDYSSIIDAQQSEVAVKHAVINALQRWFDAN